MTIEQDSDMPAGAGQAIVQRWEKFRPEEADPSEAVRGEEHGDHHAGDPEGDRGIADAIGQVLPNTARVIRDELTRAESYLEGGHLAAAHSADAAESDASSARAQRDDLRRVQ